MFDGVCEGGAGLGRGGGELGGVVALNKDPLVVALFDGDALCRDTPQSLRQGRRVVQVVLGERLLHRLSGGLGAVVWDGAVNVVYDVGGTDAVVEKVEDGAIGPVDGHEGTLDVAPVAAGKVRHVRLHKQTLVKTYPHTTNKLHRQHRTARRFTAPPQLATRCVC